MTIRKSSQSKAVLAAASLAVTWAGAQQIANASEIAEAAMRGDHDALGRLIADGVEIDAPQADGATALHWAAYRNDLDAVRRLIDAGADVHVTNRAGTTPLLLASVAGNADMLRVLLEAGADPNERFNNGETALMMAARTGRADAIEVLLAHGAEVDARESLRGTTALMWAAAYSNPDAVRVLLDAGADFAAHSAAVDRGRRPYLAPPARERIDEYLTGTGSRGAALDFDLDGEEADGAVEAPPDPTDGEPGALQAAADAGATDAQAGAADADAAARDAGVDAASRDAVGGATATAEVERVLNDAIDALADSVTALAQNEADADNNTASVEGGDGEQAAGGEQAAETQSDAESAALAALAGRVDALAERVASLAGVVAALAGRLEAAAAPDEPPPSGDAVAAQTQVNEDDEFFFAGDSQQTDWGGLTPLIFAAREGDIESARMLIEAGADVNQTSEFGWTPLLTATQNRFYQLGRYLLEQAADPNIANGSGWSPLYIATDNRNIEGGDYPTRKPDMDHLAYIELLLDAGADPNQRLAMGCGRAGCASTETRTIFTHQWLYEEGATPFLRAAQSGDLTLMKLLLEHGADPSVTTEHGVTPLMVAAGIGWVEGVTHEWSEEETFEAVKLLLELGADPNARETMDGRTALMGAAHKGRSDVVQLLVDHGADLGARDIGSRDSIHALAGVTWQAIDYADGLVRVGVQSAMANPETADLIRRLMEERGLETPPEGRTLDSICITDVCRPDYQP